MQPVTTRHATIPDLNTLLAFEQGIINAERPFDPTLVDGQIYYYDLPEMIENPNVAVIVAQSGEQVIGVGTARIIKAQVFYKYAEFAHIRFMYVAPDFRGQGINAMLMDALKAWCISRDVKELRLSVYTDNEPAINAYKKAGFSDILTEMRLPL